MTLNTEQEEQVKQNSKLITGVFRIIQTVAAGIIVLIVSVTFQEVKANGQNQTAMKTILDTIQGDLASLKLQSRQDHDELVALRTRVQIQAEKNAQ